MKYLIFIVFSCLFISFSLFFAFIRRNFIYILLVVMLLSLFFYNSTNINFFSRENYKAQTRGIEVSLLDLGMFAIFLIIILQNNVYQVTMVPPLTIPFMTFILVAILSWVQNIGMSLGSFEIGLYPLFGIWKYAKAYLFYWICYNIFYQEKSFYFILVSFIFLIICFFFLSLWQRYILGVHAVNGFLEHKHNLNGFVGMMGVFIFPMIFYVTKLWKKIFLLIVLLMSFSVVILTIGRSAIFGFSMVCFFNSLIIFSSLKSIKQNLFIVCFMFVALLSMALLSYDTLLYKFESESVVGSFEGREEVWGGVLSFSKKRLLGLGMDNFYAFNVYYSLGPADIAHNTFMLTLAEMGIFGLISYCFIYLRVFQMFFSSLYLLRNNYKTCLLLLSFGAPILFLMNQDMFHPASRNSLLLIIQQICFAGVARIYMTPNVYIKSRESIVF